MINLQSYILFIGQNELDNFFVVFRNIVKLVLYKLFNILKL